MPPTLLSSAPLPARRRKSRRLSVRRLAAWVAASATDRDGASAFVFAFAMIHALLWTVILINLKAAQDVHMDVAEAFAWGQKFQFGYGKHPPLAGWVAGLWFRMFPVTDWSTYLLAMTTVALGLVISWLIALRVVDYRRAFFVVVMLAIYPIFNFKGFKFNPDLLQLVTLPLLVLAYLDAFEKRSARSGFWLGLAGALALMTKYWVLTMVGAVGLAALIHPDRLKFLRSPAPWVAIVVAAVAMIPHLMWLKEVDFVPLTYAGDVYGHFTRAQTAMLVLGYVEHNLGLLALPVLVAALALVGISLRRPSAALARIWSPGANASVKASQALNVWIIQIVVAVGPPLGGLIFSVYMKTDWGISLFFLTPLALVAIPQLRLPEIALFRIAAVWLVLTLATLAASPYIAAREITDNPNSAFSYGARSQLARELTQIWHNRFVSRWSVVA
ncbi:MAG TPA: glycosyltransferase family 39 protein, partial [Bradyrhizobium sp.]|nr:glycosyltransferase family 39 protein [Bradyrhizobium sp.]